MKIDLNYLPKNKQREMAEIISILAKNELVEIAILFGSYARNDWVEEMYDQEHYRYQSDIDILVIVETKSEFAQNKLEHEIGCKIDLDEIIKTPVSVIVHDIAFVNRRLRKAQYFFSDIKKEGILLWDSKKYKLQEPRELLPEERLKLAQDDFDYYFKKADNSKKLVDFCMADEMLNYAAFLLHQTAESLYTVVLLVFTRYKPNTHNLVVLRKLTNALSNKVLSVFPLDNPENQNLFRLICKAYVDARYKPSYKITKEELVNLIQKVEELRQIAHSICLEKLDSFVQ